MFASPSGRRMSLKPASPTVFALSRGNFAPKFSKKASPGPVLGILLIGVASTKKGEADGSGPALPVVEVRDIPPGVLIGDAMNAVFKGDAPAGVATGDVISWPLGLPSSSNGICPMQR